MKQMWKMAGTWIVLAAAFIMVNGPLRAQYGNTGNTDTTRADKTVTNEQVDQQVAPMLGRQVDKIAKDLTSKLSLNSDQQKKVQDILQDLQKQIGDADKKISDVLDTQQKAKYADLKEKMFQRHEQRMMGKNRGNKEGKGSTGMSGTRRGTGKSKGVDTTGGR